MKEDYLWDKTGEDSEIENLENALQVFRYRETAAPELSAKVLPFRREPPRKVFQYAMAAAACVVFAAFGLVIWLQVSNNQTSIGNDSAKANAEQSNNAFPVVATVEKPGDLIVEKVQNSKPAIEGKALKVRQTIPAVVHRKDTKTQPLKNIKPDVRLTKEEQYAYSQLMLALSITSSKLKMVKDKVEGLEQ
jgi:hypothetical protein